MREITTAAGTRASGKGSLRETVFQNQLFPAYANSFQLKCDPAATVKHKKIADQIQAYKETPAPYLQRILNMQKQVREEGKLIVGTGAPTTFNETVAFVLSPLWKAIGTIDKAFSSPHVSSDYFKDKRKQLLEKTGRLETWLVSTGDNKYRSSGEGGIALTDAELNFRAAVKSRHPTSANPYSTLSAEINEGLVKVTRTNALIRAADMEEVEAALILNGEPVTDLVIDTHGSPGQIYLANEAGEDKPVSIPYASSSLFSFVSSLSSKKIISPGTRLSLVGCEVANSEEGQKHLQDLADLFGIEIYANKRTATAYTPNLNGTLTFSPQDMSRYSADLHL